MPGESRAGDGVTYLEDRRKPGVAPSRLAEHGFTLPTRSTEHGFAPRERSGEHGFAPKKGAAEHGFTSQERSTEHGFTSQERSTEHGFTLIELMVVIAIIGIASAAVALAFPDPRGPLRAEAERFAARVRAAQDAAVLRAQPIALVAAPAGYRFEARRGGRWIVLAERPLGPERWSHGAHALIAPDAAPVLADPGAAPARSPAGVARMAAEAGTARAVFDPTGLGDPLDLTLFRDDARVTVHVGIDGTVDVGR